MENSARRVKAFICANSARGGRLPTSSNRPRPHVPDVGLDSVEQIVLPCAGRLQPEHVLKVFETGVDAVCVVACASDNCHTLDGSRRCERRVEYLRALLDEVGVGSERLLFFRLPGSAREDLALGMAPPTHPTEQPQVPSSVAAKLGFIQDQMTVRVRALVPNPLRTPDTEP
jgi:coenzyme F420-reducing hydrogenase delta subunit